MTYQDTASTDRMLTDGLYGDQALTGGTYQNAFGFDGGITNQLLTDGQPTYLDEVFTDIALTESHGEPAQAYSNTLTFGDGDIVSQQSVDGQSVYPGTMFSSTLPTDFYGGYALANGVSTAAGFGTEDFLGRLPVDGQSASPEITITHTMIDEFCREQNRAREIQTAAAAFGDLGITSQPSVDTQLGFQNNMFTNTVFTQPYEEQVPTPKAYTSAFTPVNKGVTKKSSVDGWLGDPWVVTTATTPTDSCLDQTPTPQNCSDSAYAEDISTWEVCTHEIADDGSTTIDYTTPSSTCTLGREVETPRNAEPIPAVPEELAFISANEPEDAEEMIKRWVTEVEEDEARACWTH
ncbi:hypothetical protein F4861DRAFT_543734 [Xylaria intraflava]|nr:hypothetical protein F4861DRAFT_543734 [Xylaria intraflava]